MGNFNPSSPTILGNEFVGIREESIDLTTASDSEEIGYSFTLSGSTTLQDARVYTEPPVWALSDGTNVTINIYPKGKETQSGPIQRCIIPISAANVTGASATSNPSQVHPGTGVIQPFQAATSAQFAQALMGGQQPGTNVAFGPNFVVDGLGTRLLMSFDVAKYGQQLIGKRILGVNVLLDIQGSDGQSNQLAIEQNNPMQAFIAYSATGNFCTGTYFLYATDDVQRMPVDNINYANNGTGSSAAVVEGRPWSLQELMNFDPAGSGVANNRLTLWLTRNRNAPVVSSGKFFFVTYVALEVIYCEEQRVAWGCLANTGFAAVNPYFGTQIVPMHSPLTGALNPVLGAGDYTITVSGSFAYAPPGFTAGTLNTSSDPTLPPLNGLRELYDFGSIVPVKINKPWPPENALGQTFTSEVSDIMPQISLHTSSGTVADSQGYGRQDAIPIYAAINATQQINVPSSLTLTQVRYYARRFGATSTNLLLTTAGGQTAQISPQQWDSLAEIIDGWKEVTLPLSAGWAVTAGTTTMTWSAAGENIGSRWEVLGVMAPSISGTPTSHEQSLVPAPNQLDATTYRQGSTDTLTWQSPLVSGAAAADIYSDACFSLSTQPPTITGVGVTPSVLALTPLPYICGPLGTESIAPTGMPYNRITWANMGVTGTGSFGYYELQRFDTVDNAWNTIMRGTTQAINGFSDFEARIGVQSSYRIRMANGLGYLGSWSATGTGTIPAPGLLAVQPETVAGSVLTFTTNTQNSGASMAGFVQEFENNIDQALTFLEAGRNRLTFMYGKNFMSDFHPLERGGEQFDATLAVANGAVSGPVLENAFQGLRDLAWAQLPYVCVRNEIGDRWYANVSVPQGNIQGGGRIIQLAQITVTEVADVPYAVNPTSL